MNRDALSKSEAISRVVRQDIQEILDEKDKTSVLKLEPTYRSVLNQPERVAISSASAIPATQITSVVAESSFYSFVVNLPRPALNVDNLQLLSANIPQAQVCIPDDSLVFWYYRIQTQQLRWYPWGNEYIYQPGDFVSYTIGADVVNYLCIATNVATPPDTPGNIYWEVSTPAKFESPNIFNLFCVRLLPSYYKQELIVDPEKYGYNKSFNTYEELSAELKPTYTNKDLAIENGAYFSIVKPSETVVQDYMPNGFYNEDLSSNWIPDVTITYDSKTNKFNFKGLNVSTLFQIPAWDATTLYQPQSLVRYDGNLYNNVTPEFGNPPDSYEPPTSWLLYNLEDPNETWHTYLAAGFNDPNVIKLQGGKTELDWNKYHRFLPNSQSILYKGNYWTATLTNQNQPPPDDIWDADILYSVGDVVYYETTELAYTCVLAPGPPNSAWSSSTKYYLGDRVNFEGGDDYEAAANFIPIGWSPDDGPIEPTTWNYQQFSPGDLVSAQDYIDPYDPPYSPWLCIAQTSGANPLDYPRWRSIDYYVAGNRVYWYTNPFDGPYNYVVFEAITATNYLSPLENPSAWIAVPTVLPPAQAPEYWQAVTIPDPPWINLGAGTSPANPTYWAESYNPWIPYTGTTPYYTGVNYVSKKYDYCIDGISELTTQLLGIPGQPYINLALQNTINNETLNKRLGFTWTGQNMLIPFEEIKRFPVGNLVTIFYNRLRPAPSYARSAIQVPLLRYSPNLTTDQQATYTADAFCNMVYSSVVNIYTRILGGSTTDTIRNTNLLAIVPMNCGNLGVTFANNFIDNPLTKIDTDIYTIEVEFRTESGQPYWFSNNAVITLQLKLGYKK